MERKWLTYWEKSLSDSLKAEIDLKIPHYEIENFNLNSNRIEQTEEINSLIDLEEIRINKKNGVSNRESPNWEELDNVEFLISPFKLAALPEHLVLFGDGTRKYPFWYYANINRQGLLSIPKQLFPVFQRKYLEPLADEKAEFIFSSVEKVDKGTTIGKENYETFNEYIDYLKEVLKVSVEQDLISYKTDGYETIYNATILIPDEDNNAAIGIINLYQKILKENKIPQLLSHFITLKNNTQTQPLSIPELIKINSLHLGQMGFKHSLSISQRIALYTFLQGNDEVFAINGPPGTGKTTLLQSIVANKIVQSAIEGNNPAIILACSTNNQAVTNIIESFSKSTTTIGDLQGRWLPDIDSYATYLPSLPIKQNDINLKIREWKEKKWNFKDKDNRVGLFKDIENTAYVEKATAYFIDKSLIYFGLNNLSIDDSINKLQNEIKNIQAILKDATKKWNDYLNIEQLFSSSYCIKINDHLNYYSSNILNEQIFINDITDLIKLEEKIISYFKNESFFRKFFCFIGIKSALKNRASELRIILRDSLIQEKADFEFTQSYILGLIANKIETAKKIIKTIAEWTSWKDKNSIKGNPPKTEIEYWEFENIKNEGVKKKDETASQPNCFYDELDVTLRHKAFQLALHYWEGRWILKIGQDLLDKNFDGKGVDLVKNRWLRQSMLTPCFVSTFYMAPKFFGSFKFLKKGEDGKNIYDNPPLFEFIDLLVVDEAGQVAPEVGIATFSLAKQAIVVGDIKQIEPVWNISTKIDIGNLKKEGLIENYDDIIFEKEYDPKGFLASTGSIMKMAQNACNYKENDIAEKGVLLVEHRRCYDEIIAYCNELAYDGKLKPLKGKAKGDNLFKPMFCIHVDGNSVKTNASRYNQNEVDAIIDWLKLNRQKIASKYGKIEEAVGIITPFVEQKNKLQYALRTAGFNTSLMKIGTVHALQGAERHIVLFSMVYGKGDVGTMFFDIGNKPNMLNVAVSRAKDNFIVFANTGIFNKQAKTPSGILAKHLKY